MLGIISAVAMLITAVSPLILKGMQLLDKRSQESGESLRFNRGGRAILYAEEWARALLNANPAAAVDGEKKLNEALDFYMKSFPKDDRETARKYLRSLLSEAHLGAAIKRVPKTPAVGGVAG